MTQPTPSSLSSLVASRRRRRGDAEPARPAAAQAGLVTKLARTGAGVLEGHVLDAADPDRRFVVELVLDGFPAAIARAELFTADLATLPGDGCHGFCFHLDPAMLPTLRTAAVRIANTGEPVGGIVDLATAGVAPSALPPGGVEWMGGLRLAGWVHRDDGAPFPGTIEAFADGARLARTRANLWRSVPRGDRLVAEPGFELILPDAMADGRAKTVDVLCDGRPLPGSPVRLVAFEEGLRAHLLEQAETASEAILGEAFDAALPSVVPFARWREWERRFPLPPPEAAGTAPFAVVVIGAAGAERTLASPALDAGGDWVGTMLPENDGPGRFAPGDLLSFLATEPSCETVLFAAAGTQIRAGLPMRLAAALRADREASIAYCDLLLEGEDGDPAPLALPAFDYERSLEQGIGSQCFMMRRDAAIAAAERGSSDSLRLFLGPVEAAGPGCGAHLHVPVFGAVVPKGAGDAESLARSVREHLAARAVAAEVRPRPAATLPAVRVRRPPARRSLALVLDAGDDASRVEPALAALEGTIARKDVRIVVAAPEPGDDVRQRLQLAGIDLGVSPRNTASARRLAAAIEIADAELVCVLDARLRPATPNWLDELLGRFAEHGVGAVAPLILASSGLVAEAGRVMGPAGGSRPAFADRRHGDPGTGDALLVARQALAVGSACLLTRRADFQALGGFDPLLFPEHHGCVDYCLKLQALGRRVVVTPDAVLSYAAGTDVAAAESPFAKAAREREERVLFARWADVLADDPFHGPVMGRGLPAFGGLAWPPGDRSPRRPRVAQPRDVPPGW